ncbi:MAG: DNA repair protein RadC [Opitutales bacterium]|nr:DNA repair protein RadC [Opitutales bacterium]
MRDRSECAGHRERLRQRFLRSGFSGFAEHEIVELLLTFCLPCKDVKPLAKALLKQFGSIRALVDADTVELQKVPGMGRVAPVAMRFIKQFAERYFWEKSTTGTENILDHYEALEKFWILRLSGKKREILEVAFLDTHLRLLKEGVMQISDGVVDRTAVPLRKIVEGALAHNAHAIVMAHNHPSGSALPSDADCLVTQKVEKLVTTLGIRFIDHLIIAANEIYSFRKSGLITKR